MSSSPRSTPIEDAYRRLGKRALPDAAELAGAFVDSIKQLDRQIRGSGSFYPGKRKALPAPDAIRRQGRLGGTDDLAAMLWEPTRFKVGRRRELDFHYVDRELVAGRAILASGRAKITASKLWLDLLLANANGDDRTPIVAEAKLRRDKDPEQALVQGLAYAAQLGTTKQLRRLAEQYPDYFRDRASHSPPSRLDIYVITHQLPKDKRPQLRRARELADGILANRDAGKHLRRIAFLEAELRGGGVRFRCPAPPAEAADA